ncbi:MAG: Glu-tRNA(Gln) amidotransferase subunit GatE [bacterium]|nr:Glu-tRNA(Gln) amidotransferase subunit GatE [bacterium]
MVKKFGELTDKEYEKLGFKCGLEIHQQLFTKEKLFCHCPAGRYTNEYDAEILRHMRPTLSELGVYDGTALMEFKTKKNILYRLNHETACTYEFDDTPPFPLNDEALDIALEIAILLKCNLVSELHIARKQYLDGSIPTGFQRTTIVGIEGTIPYKNRKIQIRQLGLEEDACREISDKGHLRIYKTDRLGMPLIETVTYPDMKNPREAAEVAQIIRRLTRVTGKVRTGIGATRQDVNVSITGGTRIEIKGVSRIPLIPELVHNEAMRQKALLEIKAELKKRKLSEKSYKIKTLNISNLLKNTTYDPIQKVIKKDLLVNALLLPKFKNILSYPTQPEQTFENEISDRVRVIACLNTLPNIISSETKNKNLSQKEWKTISAKLSAQSTDAIIIVWGDKQDSETAIKEIEIRIKEAMEGIPSETRQALANNTTGFERILPGPNRMYPDTDLPPISVSPQRIKKIMSGIPEFPWDREKRYRQMNLPQDTIIPLITSKYSTLFDKIVKNLKIDPVLTAATIIQKFKHLKREGININNIPQPEIYKMFEAYKNRKFAKELIPVLLEKMPSTTFEKAFKSLKIKSVNIKQLQSEIKDSYAKHKKTLYKPKKKENIKLRTERFLMGKLMHKLVGAIDGKIINTELKKLLPVLIKQK